MVDSIGSGRVTNERRVGPIGRAPAIAATPAPASEESQARTTSSLTEAAQALAANPPVDSDRVAEIRRAVQKGDFPIYPAKIADRLIALAAQWNPHDEA